MLFLAGDCRTQTVVSDGVPLDAGADYRLTTTLNPLFQYVPGSAERGRTTKPRDSGQTLARSRVLVEGQQWAPHWIASDATACRTGQPRAGEAPESRSSAECHPCASCRSARCFRRDYSRDRRGRVRSTSKGAKRVRIADWLRGRALFGGHLPGIVRPNEGSGWRRAR